MERITELNKTQIAGDILIAEHMAKTKKIPFSYFIVIYLSLNVLRQSKLAMIYLAVFLQPNLAVCEYRESFFPIISTFR